MTDKVARLAAALALLVLALALRVPRGELAEWKGDEAIDTPQARAIAREGAWPRGLATTEGPHAPRLPLTAFAAPLVLFDGPEVPRLEVALLWSGAALALFLLGRGGLGGRAALAAALLVAAHPDLVRRGRAAWYPNLAGPVAALVLLALVRTVREPRGRAPGALLALSSLLGLLHYSTLGVAGLGVAASAWAARRGADRRALAAGLALALLFAAPFVAGEAASGFQDARAALSVAAHGGRVSRDPFAPERERVAYPRALLGALDLEGYARTLGPSGEAAARASGPPRTLLAALGAALVALVLAGALEGALEVGRALARRERPGPAGVALALVLAGWAPFLALRLPARDHYVQAVLPAALVLAGLALARAARLASRLSVPLVASFLLLLASASVLETRAVLVAVAAGRAEPRSPYELPYRDKRGACELLLAQELELVRYPRFEYVLLLEECYRELERADPERARRFERVACREPYWDLDYSLPRPREPRARAELVLAPGPEPVAGELGRSGAIVVRRAP